VSDCIFCRIAQGEIPAKLLAADDHVVAFHDLSPKAPTHVLIIPRRHIASLAVTDEADRDLLGRLLDAARRLATELGLADGFRVVINSGADAGQTVFHLHVHLLGGRAFGWPPG
jgi:histidine triad (HIT) family protein